MSGDNTKRLPRWWSGGVCAALAVTFTHPLDLVKVQLQTQSTKDRQSVGVIIKNIYQRAGFLGFYNGISASWFRQLTYTTARFALYETGKNYVDAENVSTKMGLATFAGLFGGMVGVPGDVVTVRLQNDSKLPPESRRNYKHVFDGLFRIYKEEGISSLFRGTVPAVSRSILLTIGTNAAYDQVKVILKATTGLEDGVPLHFATSTAAGCIATVITQPLDVLKTTFMNAKPGEFSGIGAAFISIAKQGPLAFYKGFIPALIRVSPNTIITFILYEQARMRFGYLPKD
ncbi:mitochondrial dicarboxylate carrier isoform X1 [Drosophila eugracilis]|uniref:mitochondrial dicarboxylate carrier isoform X1 n=1 Tax=Drosophila eugracilis TaxID=29029 RepID=UPI0007E84FC6|nr:mitochondrial dicarboxylate carrier isoform X1 [Drosophila eugracilis]